MMNKSSNIWKLSAFFITFFVVIFFSENCKKNFFYGKISKEGVFECFASTKKYLVKQKQLYCELSASAYHNGTLFLANDRSINTGFNYPEISSVIRYSLSGFKKEKELNFQNIEKSPKKYLLAKLFKQGSKWEDFSYDSFQDAFWGITAFDRYNDKEPGKDSYNILMYWKDADATNTKIANAVVRSGLSSSIALREIIKKALISKAFPTGPPFFKLEGITAISNKELLIGVRSFGYSYKNFKYKTIILKVFYTLNASGLVILKNNISLYDYTNIAKRISKRNGGLSSLEYDSFNKRLYMLSSFEPKNEVKSLGGMLWIVKGIIENEKIDLLPLKNEYNKILYFSHKPEAVSILSKKQILIVYDDDKVLTNYNDTLKGKKKRQVNEAVFNIIKLGN